MDINDLLVKMGMTKYKLAKKSGIPQSTIRDICSGKAHIEKCSAETIYKISKALNTTVEDLIESSIKRTSTTDSRVSFETFKSNVCHRVKEDGDLDFIANTLQTNEIRKLFERKWYAEALYLLAMVDYLSRINDLPVCANYKDIRAYKLETPVFPASIIVAAAALKDDKLKEQSRASAIPEFARFNIIEGEVRDVI